MLNEFIVGAIGSEIAEITVPYVTEWICEHAVEIDFFATHPDSHGYCSWHVRDLQSLFSLIPNVPSVIKLNDSSIMFPVKSVSG